MILFVLGITACQVPTPEYQVAQLHGTWLRTSSTNPHADSLQIEIAGDSAVIRAVPTGSDFVVGNLKWTSIVAIAQNGDFSLTDYSADGKTGKATIYMSSTSDTAFTLYNGTYPSAPGSAQTWVKQ